MIPDEAKQNEPVQTEMVFDDTPIKRVHIKDMSNEQLDGWINQVREKRLQSVREYQKEQELKRQMAADKLTKTQEKQYEMAAKEFDRLDRTLEAIDKRLTKIKTNRFELEQLWGEDLYDKGGSDG